MRNDPYILVDRKQGASPGATLGLALSEAKAVTRCPTLAPARLQHWQSQVDRLEAAVLSVALDRKQPEVSRG